ncbi:MAG: hypothetical protein OXB93_03700 [Cytophagales bacterium]|nr:hypothetical protein [Cytophagales bacterium]
MGQNMKGKQITYQADKLEGKEYAEDPHRILRGHVIFKHGITYIFCDSSRYFHKRNFVEAFGQVKVYHQDDSLYAEELYYDGNIRQVFLRQNVRYQNHPQKLLTDSLYYALPTRTLFFMGYGQLQDSLQILRSKIGFYEVKSQKSRFFQEVSLSSADYNLNTDTLYYTTSTRQANWSGQSSQIQQNKTHIYMQKAQANLKTREFTFHESLVQDPEHLFTAKVMEGDLHKKYYKGKGQVALEWTIDSLLLTGNLSVYQSQLGGSLYENFLGMKFISKDTMFLWGDRLHLLENPSGDIQTISTFPNAQILFSDIAARCDSLVYLSQDSIIHLYGNPVLWYGNDYQIKSEELRLYLKDGKLDYAQFEKPFLIGKDSLGYFNQIKGKEADVFFEGDNLDYMHLRGNGEILHFLLEEDSLLVGMNELICGEMKVHFESNKLDRFVFYIDPTGAFIPPQMLNSENIKLNGFDWKIEEKPHLKTQSKRDSQKYRQHLIQQYLSDPEPSP